MAWIGALVAAGGAYMSNQSSRNAQAGMGYSPWNTNMPGVGSARYSGGNLNILDGNTDLTRQLEAGQNASLGQFFQGQQNSLGQPFLRDSYNQANQGADQSLQQLLGHAGFGGYNAPNMMQGINSGLLSNFDPNQASSNYTNLLRQQAQPQEQQAASSALSGLFGTGRLGTSGGMQAYQGLMNSQNQADIGRQVAGQNFGMQQQLQAQQGYDQARQNQQGLMLNNFGAGQQGLMNAFGINQGMFGRQQDLYTASNTATQDRFGRALQLFGGENALNQQNLGNFTGLLGAQQSGQNQQMDLARIGASVGQSQTSANSNAAMMRNQSNQDMIAGFLGAYNSYQQNKGN